MYLLGESCKSHLRTFGTILTFKEFQEHDHKQDPIVLRSVRCFNFSGFVLICLNMSKSAWICQFRRSQFKALLFFLPTQAEQLHLPLFLLVVTGLGLDRRWFMFSTKPTPLIIFTSYPYNLLNNYRCKMLSFFNNFFSTKPFIH